MLDKGNIIKNICEDLEIENNDLISIFLYGSRVYNNHTENSDYDFIVVINQTELKSDGFESKDGLYNYTTYSQEGFQNAIEEHDISILECLSLPNNHIIYNVVDWTAKIDVVKLRNSISQKSSNSWVKAKKKLIDNENYIAQKSLYHSLRIILFGKQLATHNKIINFQEANYLWEDIKKLDLDWLIWKDKYHLFRNNLLSEFRIITPKI